jgi:hypothetical protein
MPAGPLSWLMRHRLSQDLALMASLCKQFIFLYNDAFSYALSRYDSHPYSHIFSMHLDFVCRFVK